LLARRNNKNGAGPGAKNDGDGKEVNESHQVSKALARNLNIEEDLDDDGDDDSDYMDIDDESYQVMKEEGILLANTKLKPLHRIHEQSLWRGLDYYKPVSNNGV